MIADALRHRRVVTVEDGLRDGGIGMSIDDAITAAGGGPDVTVLGVPTKFIPHAKPDAIHSALGLDADGIVAVALA